ncbi:MAG: DUF262 domain-containing protein [Verrucomicrobiales bacterium]|nr:DUF262 domain-containing protein [Verrucomicrobiales bacterium]
MDSTATSIFADLFRAERHYAVPSYQRAYSWGDDQLKDFLSDLEDHPAGKSYYLGHFLFEKGDGRRLVIDGQQRLTTIMIFFIALRDRLGPKERQEFQPWFDLYLAPSVEPRFLTVSPDQQILENLRAGVQDHRSETKSGRLILNAWKFFARHFTALETAKLHSWAETIHRANVTEFEVKDKVQATQIFTLQNNRGKNLSALELLKSYLMYQTFLHSEGQEDNYQISLIERQFEKIYRISEELELLDENDVLRYHVAAFSPHRHDGATEGLAKELAKFPESSRKLETIQRFARELTGTFEDVKLLIELIKTEERLADPVILDRGSAWPLLLVLNRHFPGQLHRDPRLQELLRHTALTLFKMAFRHGKSRNVDDLIRMANDFHRNPDRDLGSFCAYMEECSRRGFRGYDDFNEVVLGYYERISHYDAETRFLLWKQENQSRDRHDRTISPAEYINAFNHKSVSTTIEHVAPQNPDWTEYPESFQRDCLNNVGNFLLLTQGWNTSLGNTHPAEKAKRFRNSSLSQHRKVAELIESPCGVDGCDEPWCSHKIEQRHTEFLNFIKSFLELAELANH